jgi:hypothetical protein
VELLAGVAALTMSLLLLASAVGHLRRPVLPDLVAHGVLGRRTRHVVAAVLPAAELVLGLVGLTARAPALVAQAVLFAAFAGYLALVVRAVRSAGRTGVPCGCGLPEVPVGPAAVGRAAALATVALLAAAFAAGLPSDAASVALAAVAAPTLALLAAVVPAARRLPIPTGAAS